MITTSVLFLAMQLITLLILCVLSLISGEDVSPPHIIFILSDDLGYNDVGYHNPKIITPHIDQLAQSGIILEQHYAQFQCTPSRAALMTARLGTQCEYFIHTSIPQIPI